MIYANIETAINPAGVKFTEIFFYLKKKIWWGQ